jgi:hypothetical protein
LDNRHFLDSYYVFPKLAQKATLDSGEEKERKKKKEKKRRIFSLKFSFGGKKLFAE